MAKEVVIRISAQDAASPVFKKLAGEAQQMGAQVEMSNERSSRSFDNFNKGAAAVGAAIGSATLLMGEWTRAAAEDQANQARLQQSIENTGKAYDDYAQRVDAAIKKGQDLAFSDDATRDALVRLNLVTNDTGASLDELGVVMDFARAKNIDLGTAADIVGKVMGGNLGILSRYGIQLDKNATSEQALAAIQQRSAGQAQTYAQTELGQLDRMKDKWGELTESIGAHAGAMSQLLLLLPGLTAGYTALSAAVAGLGGAGGLAATGALGAALALVIGGGAAGYSANTNRGGWGDNLFANFAIGGAGVANWLTPGNAFSGVQDQFKDLKSGDNLANVVSSIFYTQPGIKINNGDAYMINQLKSAGVLPTNFNGSLADAADYITRAAGASSLSNQQYVGANIATSPNFIYDPVSGKYVQKGDYQYLQASRYYAIGGNTGSGATTMAYGSLAGMGGQSAYAGWQVNHPGYGSAKLAMYGDGPTGIVAGLGGSGAVANDISAMRTGSIRFDSATIEARSRAAAVAARDASYEAVAGAMAAIHQSASGLGLSVPTAGVSGTSNAAGVAARGQTANNAAAAGFQVAVGNTNAIASQVKSTADWATELINVAGAQGKIDDLYSRGIITLGEYNAAQDAGTRIFAANAAIQDDVLKIQADQAPIIAKLTEEQQRYMDHLADLTPEQQALRLAYMDTGEAAKAQTALTLAAAAANGELGAAGEKTASAMISAAAEADPYLRAMLEDMGLITVGADGTITVNYDDVVNSKASMDDLLGALNTLIELISQAFGIDISYNDNGAEQALNSIVGLLNSIDGRSVTYYVNQSGNGVSVGSPNGPGVIPLEYNGVTAYANGGTAYDPLLPRFQNGGGTYAIVGEIEPEVVKLARGDQVMPGPGSRAMLNRMNRRDRGSRGHTFFGPVTIQQSRSPYRAIESAQMGEVLS